MLDRAFDGLFRDSFDQGAHHGVGSGLFLLFDRSCGAIFDRTFDLGDRGLGGRLGLGGSFGLAFRSTAGLAGFRHGRRRLMKDVGGCWERYEGIRRIVY